VEGDEEGGDSRQGKDQELPPGQDMLALPGLTPSGFIHGGEPLDRADRKRCPNVIAR
jgi:hypothetical protein